MSIISVIWFVIAYRIAWIALIIYFFKVNADRFLKIKILHVVNPF